MVALGFGDMVQQERAVQMDLTAPGRPGLRRVNHRRHGQHVFRNAAAAVGAWRNHHRAIAFGGIIKIDPRHQKLGKKFLRGGDMGNPRFDMNRAKSRRQRIGIAHRDRDILMPGGIFKVLVCLQEQHADRNRIGPKQCLQGLSQRGEIAQKLQNRFDWAIRIVIGR